MAQTITESTRFALQQRAREVLGEQEGDTLMAHLPPVGWADVATKKDLEPLATKEQISEVKAEINALEVRVERGFRRQTVWMVSVLFAHSGLVAWLVDRGAS